MDHFVHYNVNKAFAFFFFNYLFLISVMCGRKPLKFLGGIHSDCYDIFILLLIVI